MAANKDKGLIYILTNPSFQSYQKIGMTMNETAEERIVAGLNKASCLPFSFRVYATYTVNGDKRSVEMVEEEIHKIIDAVNDTLRARENVGKAKAREREFFLITPDKAYSLFESIATLRGDKESNLRLIAPTKAQADEAAVAEAAEQSIQERQKKQKTVTQYFADTTDELKALYTKVEQFILDLGDVEKKINDN
ncbi:MAG: GIY-YIG nuclease family protein, partial [Clostridiales bacterium]|nr:GIY-YIG nuclease family protein [Clostridiales bacterium]